MRRRVRRDGLQIADRRFARGSRRRSAPTATSVRRKGSARKRGSCRTRMACAALLSADGDPAMAIPSRRPSRRPPRRRPPSRSPRHGAPVPAGTGYPSYPLCYHFPLCPAGLAVASIPHSRGPVYAGRADCPSRHTRLLRSGLPCMAPHIVTMTPSPPRPGPSAVRHFENPGIGSTVKGSVPPRCAIAQSAKERKRPCVESAERSDLMAA